METIYFDNSATTKPDTETLDEAEKVLREEWGNPSSKHFVGIEGKHVIDRARKDVYALTRALPSDGQVIFTVSGTTANNLSIFGSINAKNREKKGRIIISDGEHASVEKPCEELEKQGFEIIRIPTNGGKLDLNMLESEASKGVIFASFMLVNNVTGAIYDVKKASDIVHGYNPKANVHSDCVQAFGKIHFSPRAIGADIISFSSHKLFAPRGAGGIWLSSALSKEKRISPYEYGGGQEFGFFSGTENSAAISAFGVACRKALAENDTRAEQIKKVRTSIVDGLNRIDGVELNVPERHIDNIINISVPGIRSEVMLNYLSSNGICVSAGSACSSHSKEVSSALVSFGLDDAQVDSSIRISISHENTLDESEKFLNVIKTGINTLQHVKK